MPSVAHFIYVVTCEKKLTMFGACDEDLVTLPNNERVKVECISEVVVLTHDRVGRRLKNVLLRLDLY